MDGHLGSSAHAWTQRSPSLRSGSSLSPGKWGSRSSAAGRRVGEAESAVEQRRTEPEGERQPGRREADGLAGVVGRRIVGPGGRSKLSGRLTGHHPLGGHGPGAEQLDQLVTGLGEDVERGEVHPVLRGRDDARLVLAVEGVSGSSCRSVSVVGVAQCDPGSGGERAARDGEPEAAGENTATGETTALRSALAACADHDGREARQRLREGVDGVESSFTSAALSSS